MLCIVYIPHPLIDQPPPPIMMYCNLHDTVHTGTNQLMVTKQEGNNFHLSHVHLIRILGLTDSIDVLIYIYMCTCTCTNSQP